jgi:hypothetical protein
MEDRLRLLTQQFAWGANGSYFSQGYDMSAAKLSALDVKRSLPEILSQVSLLTQAQYRAWDNFIDQCPQATFFHRAGWQQIMEQGIWASNLVSLH